MSEVKVIIQDNLGSNEQITKHTSSNPATKTIQSAQPVASVEEAKTSGINMKNLAIASMLAKQSFNYATSNVGKWTGNSHNQQIVNNISDIASLGMLAVVNPGIALATLTFRLTTTAIDDAWENRRNEQASQRRLARAGFSSSGEAIGFRRNT